MRNLIPGESLRIEHNTDGNVVVSFTLKIEARRRTDLYSGEPLAVKFAKEEVQSEMYKYCKQLLLDAYGLTEKDLDRFLAMGSVDTLSKTFPTE